MEDKGKLLSDEGIILPGSVVEIICSGLGEKSDYMGKEIGRCFGIEEVGDLISKGTKGAARIVFRRRNANELGPIDYRLTISADASEFKAIIPDGTQMRLGVANDDDLVAHLHHVAMEMIPSSDRGEEWTIFFCTEADRGLNQSRPPSDRRSLGPASVLSSRWPDRPHACVQRDRPDPDRECGKDKAASGRMHTDALGCSGGFSQTVDRTRPFVSSTAQA